MSTNYIDTLWDHVISGEQYETDSQLFGKIRRFVAPHIITHCSQTFVTHASITENTYFYDCTFDPKQVMSITADVVVFDHCVATLPAVIKSLKDVIVIDTYWHEFGGLRTRNIFTTCKLINTTASGDVCNYSIYTCPEGDERAFTIDNISANGGIIAEGSSRYILNNVVARGQEYNHAVFETSRLEL